MRELLQANGQSGRRLHRQGGVGRADRGQVGVTSPTAKFITAQELPKCADHALTFGARRATIYSGVVSASAHVLVVGHRSSNQEMKQWQSQIGLQRSQSGSSVSLKNRSGRLATMAHVAAPYTRYPSAYRAHLQNNGQRSSSRLGIIRLSTHRDTDQASRWS